MPDDRTPAGEDLMHDVPPEKSIPAAGPERHHDQDRRAAADSLASELRARPSIPDAERRAGTSRHRDHESAAPLDGRS